MKFTNLIGVHIKEVYEGGNWTDVNFADTLKNINWQQAQQKTSASPNTIASIVHHVFYWNGIMMQRLNGINPFVPEANGYNVNELKNEYDWNALKEKIHQSFTELAAALSNFPEERLPETSPSGKSSYYKSFQGIVEHAYYHLGQIVIIKKLVLAAG